MKTKLHHLIVCMVFSILMLGCSAEKAHAASKTHDPLAALVSFGFYLYDKPIDLSEMTIPALKGGSISNKDFIGKVSLLNFWASWCPPCRSEMPSIERLYAAMKGKKFEIIAVNAGERLKQVEDFISKHNYTFPIYLDETNALTGVFAARGIPVTYVINKEGKIVAVRPGAMEYDQAALIKIFKELADG